MFHTPPADNSKEWLYSESAKNSYQPSSPTKSSSISRSAVKLIVNQEKINIIESEINKISKLPFQLQLPIDEFVTSLKKPRYSKPLKPFQIAQLFKTFYKSYHGKMKTFLEESTPDLVELKSFTPDNKDASREDDFYSTLRINLKLNHYVRLSDMYLFEHIYDKDNFKLYHKLFKIDSDDLLIQDKFNEKMKLLKWLNIDMVNFIDDENVANSIKNSDGSSISAIFNDLKYLDDCFTPVAKLNAFLVVTKKIIELIQASLTELGMSETIINNDLLLPVLIYFVIHFNETKSLCLNLIFIKRFLDEDYMFDSTYLFKNNNFVIELSNLLDKYQNKSELLYTLTTFEALVTYLLNVSLEDLSYTPSEEQAAKLNENDLTLLHGSIKPNIKELQEDENFTAKLELSSTTNNIISQQSQKHRSRSSSTNSLNQKSFYNLPTEIADQSIRTIGLAFDSSFKTIIGRFPFKTSDVHVPQPSHSQNTSSTRAQSPLQTANSTNTPEIINNVTSNESVSSTEDQHMVSNSPFNKFTSGMNEVMKSFRPTLSSTSLNQELEVSNGTNHISNSNTATTSTANSNITTSAIAITANSSKKKNRTRAASLQIFDKFNINKPSLPRNLSHQFDSYGSYKNGSDNEIKSIGSIHEIEPEKEEKVDDKVQSNDNEDNDKEIEGNEKDLDEDLLFKFHGKNFDDLTITELRELVENYNSIIDFLKED